MFNTKQPINNKRSFIIKAFALCISFIIIAISIINPTTAWLQDKDEKDNTYSIGQVSCKVIKDATSNSIAVHNTSDKDVYIRVRLIGYQTNKDGSIIGGTDLPENLKINDKEWLTVGEYYYCKAKIGISKDTPTIIENYQSVDSQTVQVLAEAIQGDPVNAVESAWSDVKVDNNGTLVLANNK